MTNSLAGLSYLNAPVITTPTRHLRFSIFFFHATDDNRLSPNFHTVVPLLDYDVEPVFAFSYPLRYSTSICISIFQRFSSTRHSLPTYPFLELRISLHRHRRKNGSNGEKESDHRHGVRLLFSEGYHYRFWETSLSPGKFGSGYQNRHGCNCICFSRTLLLLETHYPKANRGLDPRCTLVNSTQTTIITSFTSWHHFQERPM